MTSEDKQNLIKQNDERKIIFKETEGNKYIKVDTVNKMWYFFRKREMHPDIFTFDELLNYELNVDDSTVTKGGLGSAVGGGLLFGGVGAIVGGGLGKKNKQYIEKMYISVTTNNRYITNDKTQFITARTGRNSLVYEVAMSEAEQTVALLDRISAQQTKQAASESSTHSAADEILKFKSLLDAGILTQEEFDKKKTELLNL